MGLKFRRGTTAEKSGSLAFGEPYVNTTLGTLQIGGTTGDITLSTSGTGSTGNFGAISGSGLDITGNANVAGNLSVGGQLTIGDNTSDTVNVVASLSSSLIPQTDNVFDLGSTTKSWRDLYISTGSIKVVSNGEVVSTLSTNADGSQNFPNGLSVTGSLKVSGSLVVSGSTSFNKKLKIGPDIGAGINSSFENALEIGSNPDVGLGGAMFLGNTIGSSTWGMLSNGSNNFAIANQSGFQSRAVTLYNTENKIEFLYSGSINANGSGFHNIRFDENGIIPYAANQYDLGSETNYFRDLYVSTGSIKIVANGSVVSSITTNADGSQNFQKGLNVSGSLIVTGSITATGDVVAYSTSDKRHKNNIVLISDALSKVTKLNGVTWEWNDDVDVITKETPKTGLIAQEVKEVLPEVVKEREDGFLALDYSKMMGLMVESIKELSAKIDRLENK